MMDPLAANLRRLLAERDWTIHEAARQTAVDERTLKGILSGRGGHPHARTLHRLADGFEVPVATLLTAPDVSREAFDRETNPSVAEALEREPHLFANWTGREFDELCSRFGSGGALTVEGALEAARRMNVKRAALAQAAVVLETSEAELMIAMIETLYRRVTIPPAERRGLG